MRTIIRQLATALLFANSSTVRELKHKIVCRYGADKFRHINTEARRLADML